MLEETTQVLHTFLLTTGAAKKDDILHMAVLIYTLDYGGYANKQLSECFLSVIYTLLNFSKHYVLQLT